jgi:hypothetical protein
MQRVRRGRQVAEDGAAVSLQLQTNETISEVALAKDDIAGLVHLLLVLPLV